jgi:hypothetical protein
MSAVAASARWPAISVLYVAQALLTLLALLLGGPASLVLSAAEKCRAAREALLRRT